MVEQTAQIDPRSLTHVPKTVERPKHFASYPIQIGDMEGHVSREMVQTIQAHNRSIAAQNSSNGFAVVTDSHLGNWKFLIRDARLSQTFFGITYRCKSQEQAEQYGEQALAAILNIILD